MELYLDLLDQLLEVIPELHADRIAQYGRKHVAERQKFIGRLLSLSFSRRYPHRLERGADAFSARFLTTGLRCHRGDCERLLEPFYDFPKGNSGYSRRLRLTKPYRLKPHILEAVRSVYASGKPARVVMRTEEGHEYTVRGQELLGVSDVFPVRDPHIRVPAILPLSLDCVDNAIHQVGQWIEEHGPDVPLEAKGSLQSGGA